MKNQNIVVIAIAFALAFALGPVTKAAPTPQGGPTVDTAPASATNPANAPAATAAATQSSDAEIPVDYHCLECGQRPFVNIHSTGNILRGKTGSFVLEMKPALMFRGMFVNFKVSGTAVAGVDYRGLISPAYIGSSGYAVISFATMLDPRGSFNKQAYSVVVTLEPGPGYVIGSATSQEPSATIWIKSCAACGPANW